MIETELRSKIIAEALEWKFTPYHYRPAATAKAIAALKGTGADCLTFMVGVYYNVGLVGDITIPFYRRDFMIHNYRRDIVGGPVEESYLEGVLGYGREVENPLPGDVVLYRFREGQIFAHGGIVLEWPMIIHCFIGRFGVIEADGTQGRHTGVERKFISAFPLRTDLGD